MSNDTETKQEKWWRDPKWLIPLLVATILKLLGDFGLMADARRALDAAGGFRGVLGRLIAFGQQAAPFVWPLIVGYGVYRFAMQRSASQMAAVRSEFATVLDAYRRKLDAQNLTTRDDVADLRKRMEKELPALLERRAQDAERSGRAALEIHVKELRDEITALKGTLDETRGTVEFVKVTHEKQFAPFVRLKMMIEAAEDHPDAGMFVLTPEFADALRLGEALGVLTSSKAPGGELGWTLARRSLSKRRDD